MDAYLRLAELCERDANATRDPRERQQFRVLSETIRTWAEETPAGAPSGDGSSSRTDVV